MRCASGAAGSSSVAPHGFYHCFGLVRRHHHVLIPLEEDHGRAKPLHGARVSATDTDPPARDMDRPDPSKYRDSNLWDARQYGEVADSVVARAASKIIPKSQSSEHRVASGAAARNHTARSHQPSPGPQENARRSHNRRHRRCPNFRQPLPIHPRRSRCCRHSSRPEPKSPARPVLGSQIQRAGCRRSRPAVALHQQRRLVAGGRPIVRMERRIV